MSIELSKYYLSEAKIALRYTKNALPLGAADNVSDQLRTGFTVNLALLPSRGFKNMGSAINAVFGVEESAIQYYRRVAYFAEEYGVGNCQEQAAVAFCYLVNRGVKPVELMYRTNHLFVIVGRGPSPRDAGSPDDPTTWANHCWVCDPWKNKVYLGNHYFNHETEKPLLEVEYR